MLLINIFKKHTHYPHTHITHTLLTHTDTKHTHTTQTHTLPIGFVMTGDSFIMYSCQLIDVTEWCVFRKILHWTAWNSVLWQQDIVIVIGCTLNWQKKLLVNSLCNSLHHLLQISAIPKHNQTHRLHKNSFSIVCHKQALHSNINFQVQFIVQ